MEHERSGRMTALLSAALALLPQDRAGFIAHACRGDAALERELRALLDSHGETGVLLDPVAETAASPGSGGPASDQSRQSGQQAGTLVAARYRLGGPIGHGGMGVVYRATDEQLHRPAAVKILPETVRDDQDRLARFRNEARALAALNNPHIITIFEVGETGAAPFIAMELVEGETLRARLKRGPLPVRDALDVALQIARALAAAHDKRIVHRDIKPENVMIRADGYVKVLDFGLAALRAPLASDRSALTAGAFETVAAGVVGTPAYMSPEQIDAGAVDARTDIFSLGIVLCEALTGANPFLRPTVLETLAAIGQTPASVTAGTAALPAAVRTIVLRMLEKAPADRYSSAEALTADLQALRAALDAPAVAPRRSRAAVVVAASLAFVVTASVASFAYRGSERRHWVLEQAIPEINRLATAGKSASAFSLIDTAERYLPGDPDLAHAVAAATHVVTIHSSPVGAVVEVKDYLDPTEPWLRLGTTPLDKVRIPGGYLRWRISKAGVGESLTAPSSRSTMNFDLQAAASAPAGMVPVPAGSWTDSLAFLGWLGPYALPAFDVDRLEVTNRQYQEFVDKGGYENHAYWTEPFVRDGRTLTWAEAMDVFRDQTRRPGPSTWEGGHYPTGKDDFPVSGVSWYEAAAYAAFAGKSLPVLAQDFKLAPPAFDKYVVPFSNLSNEPAKTAQFEGLGVFGTSDLVGNVREWTRNATDAGSRYLLGRLASSYGPEALPPFDRTPLNGLRCVLNAGPIPLDAQAPRTMLKRDFSKATPVSDDVFRAYRSMYAYEHDVPLHATVETVPDPGQEWIKQKITYDAAYAHERVSAFLFLPKGAHPPFETVVFFPSARVNSRKDSADLGDLNFMDYVVQSGRAVIYPIYANMYERKSAISSSPTPAIPRGLMTAWSRDIGRAVDYLATRPDIDMARLGYLGVSQGSAWGVIFAALEPRFKTVVFLDGGFFQWEQKTPGLDQADFAPRIRVPALMVNGKYDATFPYASAQLPLFQMLGSPAADKHHLTYETPHDVTQQHTDLVRDVLAWYDKYLGPVR